MRRSPGSGKVRLFPGGRNLDWVEGSLSAPDSIFEIDKNLAGLYEKEVLLPQWRELK